MSEELDELSLLNEMDIPEVMRDKTRDFASKPTSKKFSSGLFLGLGGAILLSVGAIAIWQNYAGQTKLTLTPVNPTATVNATSSTTNTTPTTTANPTATGEPAQLLGHFAYEEAPQNQLVAITADGRLKLRPAAAQKFQEMKEAAQRDGVNLNLISGFRSIKDQEYLFFKVKEERAQDTTKRAEVSAPPHHSEHHTGYAIDVGDANTPATNLNRDFENTAAFRWLQKNAARYSFEMSFPKNNPQKVSYEPWHWRFVGDQDSLETFYRSRNVGTITATPTKTP